jgi:hypothetical protein
MTGKRQVLLDLICYASARGKPAVLNVHPESIMELSMRGLIELREDGYWITEQGREQCPQQYAPDQDLRSPSRTGNVWQGHEISPRQAPARVASEPQSVSENLSSVWRRMVKVR